MRTKNKIIILLTYLFSIFIFSCNPDVDTENPLQIDTIETSLENLADDSHWFFNFNGTIDGGEGYDLILSSSDNKLYVCGAFLHVNNNWNMKNLTRLNLSDYTWEQVPGIDEYHTNFIRCVAEDNSGNLYFGGDFSSIGGKPAGRVGKFNPNSGVWESLRDIDFFIEEEQYGPISGGVYALEVIDNYVYIGGGIFNTDSVELKYLRKFDIENNKWESVPGSFDGRIRAISKDNQGNLYVGGEFTTIDNITANYIAKWDGSNWSNLSAGVDNYVLAIECYEQNVFVGGSFKKVDNDITSHGIAKWNGTNWEAMDKGITSSWKGTPTVQDIAIDSDGLVYIGGFFDLTYSDLDSLNHVGVFYDGKWRQLGAGLAQSSSQGVIGMFADGKNVYFTGYFSKGTGSPNDKINMAIWNETVNF